MGFVHTTMNFGCSLTPRLEIIHLAKRSEDGEECMMFDNDFGILVWIFAWIFAWFLLFFGMYVQYDSDEVSKIFGTYARYIKEGLRKGIGETFDVLMRS